MFAICELDGDVKTMFSFTASPPFSLHPSNGNSIDFLVVEFYIVTQSRGRLPNRSPLCVCGGGLQVRQP